MPPNPHPLVVHFTIALIIASVLCDLLGWLWKKPFFHTVGWWNLVFGFFGAFVTVATGLYAEGHVEHTDAAHAVMEKHQTLGLTVLGIVAGLFLWRLLRRGEIPQKLWSLYLVVGIAAVGVMTVGAYYGGELVYTHGVAVRAVSPPPEHQHKPDGEDQEGAHSSAPPDTLSKTKAAQPHVHNGGQTQKH